MRNHYRHILFAAIAFALCSFSPRLLAQGAAQEPIPAAQTENLPHSQPHEHTYAANDAHTSDAHDAHAANAHADAEDAHAGHGHGDHGDGAHHGETTGQFFMKLINFLIFAALIFLALKGILSKAFKDRAADIEAKLAGSEKERAEGQAQLRDLEARMAGLQEELGGIMAKAESEAEAEKQRILEAARAEAEQIIAQAQSEIEHQKRLAEAELRQLVAKLAVEGAEARIRQCVQGDSVAGIMDRAIQQIGGAN
jgi:F-type H+-transporting ATPase subunit b